MSEGRGAWNSKGVGGTLKLDKKTKKTVPGPYYMLSTDPNQWIGLKTFLFQLTGKPVELNELAAYHGVLAIQVLASAYLGEQVPLNGVFETITSAYVKKVQEKAKHTVEGKPLVADGIVGQATMKVLLLPLIKSASSKRDLDWKVVYGILANEGVFDPGAVGYFDSNDLGLAQINILAHPDTTVSQAFCASHSVNFVANTFEHRLHIFKEVDLAVASYNLGIAGTNQWIKKGQPDEWTPSWADKPRNTRVYIDRILSAANGVK